MFPGPLSTMPIFAKTLGSSCISVLFSVVMIMSGRLLEVTGGATNQDGVVRYKRLVLLMLKERKKLLLISEDVADLLWICMASVFAPLVMRLFHRAGSIIYSCGRPPWYNSASRMSVASASYAGGLPAIFPRAISVPFR